MSFYLQSLARLPKNFSSFLNKGGILTAKEFFEWYEDTINMEYKTILLEKKLENNCKIDELHLMSLTVCNVCLDIMKHTRQNLPAKIE